MTDDWSRHGHERHAAMPVGEVIEITLAGPSDHRPPTGDADDLVLGTPDRGTSEPNWRKIVGIASIVGVALGAIVAAAVLAGEDDPVDPSTTTLAPEEASALITTPPTLPPVGAVDDGFTGEGPVDASAPTIPTYTPIVSDDGVSSADIELDLPVTPLDRPVVADITISRSGETFGGPAVYDPVNERVRIALGDGSVEQTLLVDLADEDVLLSVSDVDAPDDGQRWQRMGDDLFGRAGRLDLREYVEALVLGPVRADNVAEAMRAPVGWVMLDDATIARQWIVTMEVDAVPEWDLLYGIGGDEDDAERWLRFETYVSEDGATYVTQGINDTGGETISTVHRVRLGDGVAGPIDWPSDDLIDDVPAFEDPPTTTPPAVGLDELRPVYEVDPLADPADFDLDVALDAMRTARPPAMTIWERGPRGVSETVILRDEANDRLALTRRVIETVDDVEPFAAYYAQIDDRPSGTGWLRRDEADPWVSAPLGNGIMPIDQRWELGLVTADELGVAQRVGTGATPVVLDNGVVAKPFTLLLPAGAIQWDEPLVGGISTSNPLEAIVFVGDDGLVHEIQLIANQGLPRLFQQRFDRGRPAVTVELP